MLVKSKNYSPVFSNTVFPNLFVSKNIENSQLPYSPAEYAILIFPPEAQSSDKTGNRLLFLSSRRTPHLEIPPIHRSSEVPVATAKIARPKLAYLKKALNFNVPARGLQLDALVTCVSAHPALPRARAELIGKYICGTIVRPRVPSVRQRVHAPTRGEPRVCGARMHGGARRPGASDRERQTERRRRRWTGRDSLAIRVT